MYIWFAGSGSELGLIAREASIEAAVKSKGLVNSHSLDRSVVFCMYCTIILLSYCHRMCFSIVCLLNGRLVNISTYENRTRYCRELSDSPSFNDNEAVMRGRKLVMKSTC